MSRSLPLALFTLCLAAALPGQAQPGPGHGRHDGAPGAQGRGPGHHAPKRQRPPPRAMDLPPRMDRGPREEARGAGPDHDFRRGGRLPMEYRNRTYVVDDWRGHHLSAPPRGAHWVQTGGDYVLVAIATGVILQLLIGN